MIERLMTVDWQLLGYGAFAGGVVIVALVAFLTRSIDAPAAIHTHAAPAAPVKAFHVSPAVISRSLLALERGYLAVMRGLDSIRTADLIMSPDASDESMNQSVSQEPRQKSEMEIEKLEKGLTAAQCDVIIRLMIDGKTPTVTDLAKMRGGNLQKSLQEIRAFMQQYREEQAGDPKSRPFLRNTNGEIAVNDDEPIAISNAA